MRTFAKLSFLAVFLAVASVQAIGPRTAAIRSGGQYGCRLSITISGAGSSGANGTYFWDGTYWIGQPRYVKYGDNTYVIVRAQNPAQDGWRIRSGGNNGTSLYGTTGPFMETSWSTVQGTNPAPASLVTGNSGEADRHSPLALERLSDASFESDLAASLTNVRKLSLDPATPVLTRVAVSNGFVVSGLGDSRDGFYFDSGMIEDGNPLYVQPGYTGADSDWKVYHTAIVGGDGWTLYSANGSTSDTHSAVAPTFGSFPWEFSWTDNIAGVITLTHPAVQRLNAPSTAQGGVVVLGGTQDGVYTDRTASSGQISGKSAFGLLGFTDSDVFDSNNTKFYWDSGLVSWIIKDTGGTDLYYSLSDVATPDLASNWKKASDDSPASITVTSVSVGEIAAGLFVANDGVTNGSSYVSQAFHGRQYYMGLNGGGSNNMHWDTDYHVWTDDVGEWTADNVAFPWQGTDAHSSHNGATFSRNNVAAEANWTVVP